MGDPLICIEVKDDISEPTQAEIEEFAKIIGIDKEKEPHLLYLARECIQAPLPENWRPCHDSTKNAWFYYNCTAQKSQWEHPMNHVYRDKVIQARADLAMNKLQSFDPLTTRPPKSLPPLKKPGSGLAPINPAISSLGKLGGLNSAAGDLRQNISQPYNSFNNSSIPLNSPKNSLGRPIASANIISSSSLNSLKDVDRDDDSPPLVRPQLQQRKAGLTLTGGGANFLKDTGAASEGGPTKPKVGTLFNNNSKDQGDELSDPEAAGPVEKKPYKSILINPIARSRPSDNVYELDGFSINPDEMTDNEKMAYSQMESASASTRSKGNVKFNLDENTELKFELSGDENDDIQQLEDEQAGRRSDEDESDDEEETSQSSSKYTGPDQQKWIPNGSGGGGDANIMNPEILGTVRAYSDASNVEAMKRALREEMEEELRKFKDQLDQERKSRQEQIKKHLEETIAQFKSEKDETLKKLKKDLETEKNLEVDKAKREIDTLLQREIEEMKSKFEKTLQQRQKELEEEHRKKLEGLVAEYKKEMEEELRKFKYQLEQERKSRQEQIKKHLEETIAQFKSEKDETLKKLKKDLETEKNLKVAKTKREIDTLLQREIEEMKSKFEETLQQRQEELEEEHRKKLEELVAEYKKRNETSEEFIKQGEEFEKQKEGIREDQKSKKGKSRKKPSSTTVPGGKSARNVSPSSPPTHDSDSNDFPPQPQLVSRSVSVIPQDLSGPHSEPNSEDTHQRIVEEAKAFIRMQKNRLNDPSPIPSASHLIPKPKNNHILFDEKLLKSVSSARRPAVIHLDLVSETESSGVSSLKDHRSLESKKLSRDIEEICNSLNNLDQQMKLMWSVVKGKQQEESMSLLHATPTSIDFDAFLPNSVPMILGKASRVSASLPASARKPIAPRTSPTNTLSKEDHSGKNYSSLLATSQNSSSQTVLDALRMSGLSASRLDCTDLLQSLEDELQEFKTTKQMLVDMQHGTPVRGSDRKMIVHQKHNNTSSHNITNSSILEKTKDLQDWIKKY